MSDLIDRQAAIDALNKMKIYRPLDSDRYVISDCLNKIVNLPSAQPEIIRCRECKHNPKDTWFECPMSHLSEKQRPETAWCWKGERRTDENNY